MWAWFRGYEAFLVETTTSMAVVLGGILIIVFVMVPGIIGGIIVSIRRIKSLEPH